MILECAVYLVGMQQRDFASSKIDRDVANCTNRLTKATNERSVIDGARLGVGAVVFLHGWHDPT